MPVMIIMAVVALVSAGIKVYGQVKANEAIGAQGRSATEEAEQAIRLQKARGDAAAIRANYQTRLDAEAVLLADQKRNGNIQLLTYIALGIVAVSALIWGVIRLFNSRSVAAD